MPYNPLEYSCVCHTTYSKEAGSTKDRQQLLSHPPPPLRVSLLSPLRVSPCTMLFSCDSVPSTLGVASIDCFSLRHSVTPSITRYRPFTALMLCPLTPHVQGIDWSFGCLWHKLSLAQRDNKTIHRKSRLYGGSTRESIG